MSRDWLEAIRKEKLLTQKQVAEKAGIAQAFYCQIESGDRNVSVDSAKKIAEALDFAWTDFFSDERGEASG